MQIDVTPDIYMKMMEVGDEMETFESIHRFYSNTDEYRSDLQKKYPTADEMKAHIKDAVHNKRMVDGTPDFSIFYQGRLAGFFEFHPLSSGNHIEVGYWLYEEFRRKGILSKVFPHMVEYAKNNFDKTQILATTAISNIPSQKLLERCGLKKTGRILDIKKEDSTVVKEFEYTMEIVPRPN